MKDLTQNESPTIHVKVTVQKDGGNYQATYDPKIIEVNEPETIIHFKLVTPTPDDIVIKSVSISPEAQDQLSPPSISSNGKAMTLSDLNTAGQTFSLTFSYRDKHAISDRTAQPADGAVDFPIIVNNPPGLQPMLAAVSDGVPVNNPPG